VKSHAERIRPFKNPRLIFEITAINAGNFIGTHAAPPINPAAQPA